MFSHVDGMAEECKQNTNSRFGLPLCLNQKAARGEALLTSTFKGIKLPYNDGNISGILLNHKTYEFKIDSWTKESISWCANFEMLYWMFHFKLVRNLALHVMKPLMIYIDSKCSFCSI